VGRKSNISDWTWALIDYLGGGSDIYGAWRRGYIVRTYAVNCMERSISKDSFPPAEEAVGHFELARSHLWHTFCIGVEER
jgi:hypothetical protein